jgi:hypothetical protein
MKYNKNRSNYNKINDIWQVFLLPEFYRTCSKMKSAQWGVNIQ